mmetsp:Transcript_56810/g.169620  ORF Transcript_56810/g.169620 Transcript_56810/m.169620 type:complete len:91 (-) Transcript_56810:1212-1484(-)
MVEATKRWAEEEQKKKGIASTTVAMIYSRKHGANLSDRTISKFIQNGRIGEPLSKRGPIGKLSSALMDILAKFSRSICSTARRKVQLLAL